MLNQPAGRAGLINGLAGSWARDMFIDTNDMSPGLYFYHISAGEYSAIKKVLTTKIIFPHPI